MKQGNFFTPPYSKDELKEMTRIGIQKAGVSADPQWRRVAKQIVREIAAEGNPFTSDDLWKRLDKEHVHTHEPRALGAIMMKHEYIPCSLGDVGRRGD